MNIKSTKHELLVEGMWHEKNANSRLMTIHPSLQYQAASRHVYFSQDATIFIADYCQVILKKPEKH